jgi:hypothetical protein
VLAGSDDLEVVAADAVPDKLHGGSVPPDEDAVGVDRVGREVERREQLADAGIEDVGKLVWGCRLRHRFVGFGG